MEKINVMVDKELKRSVDEKLRKINLTPSTVITLFYQYINENNRLPFDVQTILRTNEDIKIGIESSASSAFMCLSLIVNNLISEGGISKGLLQTSLGGLEKNRDLLRYDTELLLKRNGDIFYASNVEGILQLVEHAMTLLEELNHFAGSYVSIDYSKTAKLTGFLSELEIKMSIIN